MMEYIRKWLRGSDEPAIQPEADIHLLDDIANECEVPEPRREADRTDRRRDHVRRAEIDREDKRNFKQDKADTEGRVAHVLRSREQYRRNP